MKIYQKHALIAFICSVIFPIHIYLVFTNLFWPDLGWGIRQWHEILGSELGLVPVVTILTYFMSKDFNS